MHNYETSSKMCKAVAEIGKNLTEQLEDVSWKKTVSGYEAKAYHLVLNKYRFHEKHGLDRHQDKAITYDSKNPITSLSYGCGALLEITNSNKDKRRTALYYQFEGDAIIMSGPFNEKFYHRVPAVATWKELIESCSNVRSLPPEEMQAAERLMEEMSLGQPCTRYNCTIRWHEKHMAGCPMEKDAASFVASGSQAKESSAQLDQKKTGSSSKAALPKNLEKAVRIVMPKAEAMDEEKAVSSDNCGIQMPIAEAMEEEKAVKAEAMEEEDTGTKSVVTLQLVDIIEAFPDFSLGIRMLPITPSQATIVEYK